MGILELNTGTHGEHGFTNIPNPRPTALQVHQLFGQATPNNDPFCSNMSLLQHLTIPQGNTYYQASNLMRPALSTVCLLKAKVFIATLIDRLNVPILHPM